MRFILSPIGLVDKNVVMGHMRNGLKIYLDPKILTSNAASVQHPESIDSMWVAHIPMQQRAGRQDSSAPAPHSIPAVLGRAEPEPTSQRQEALSYVCEWKNGADGGGKYKGLQRKAPHAQIRRMMGKGRISKKNTDTSDLEKVHHAVRCVDHRFFGIFYPCFRQAKLLPLLPPSHTTAGASGDRAAKSPLKAGEIIGRD